MIFGLHVLHEDLLESRQIRYQKKADDVSFHMVLAVLSL